MLKFPVLKRGRAEQHELGNAHVPNHIGLGQPISGDAGRIDGAENGRIGEYDGRIKQEASEQEQPLAQRMLDAEPGRLRKYH